MSKSKLKAQSDSEGVRRGADERGRAGEVEEIVEEFLEGFGNDFRRRVESATTHAK